MVITMLRAVQIQDVFVFESAFVFYWIVFHVRTINLHGQECHFIYF